MPHATARYLPALAALLSLSLGPACGDEAKRRLGGLCGSDGDCEQGICGGGICIDPAADEDRDGLVNGLEVDLGTNPLAADTDNDGVADPAP